MYVFNPYYSQALIYTAISYADLAVAQFLIGSKIWDTWIYVLKTLYYSFFLLILPSLFIVTRVVQIISGNKKRASQGLTKIEISYSVW